MHSGQKKLKAGGNMKLVRNTILSGRCWSWIVLMLFASAVAVLEYTDVAFPEADELAANEIVLPSGYTRVSLPPLA